ncbi:MAG: hypothetical protein ABMA14_25250, partial [Hyphomonadaceae bacterium]
MSTQLRSALLSAGLVLAAGCATGPATPSSEAEREGWPGATIEIRLDDVAAGKIIAQRECASCHAIDAYSSSKNSSAPPLREVLAVNDPDFLAYRFIDAMRVG